MAYDAFISYSHAADGRLAPAVQTGLQRLARPWYKVRALRVFRDQTGLAVNPHLWSSITTAMAESSYFVLMASPEAAASPWVNREIEHWCTINDPDHILPVLTDGTLTWDAARGDYDPAASTALPPALASRFSDEPRHLDLRWARDETELDLRHSKFREAVADLAAPMHGIPKEELESEDVRRHRRAIALARTGALSLLLFALAAIVASVFAVTNASRANAQADKARVAATRATAAATREREAREAEASAAEQARQASDRAQIEAANAESQRLAADAASLTAQQEADNARRAETDRAAEADRARRAAARAEASAKTADVAAHQAAASADEAARQRDAANVAAAEAVRQRDVATNALEDARRQTAAARSRALAGSAIRAVEEKQLDLAMLLAIESKNAADASGGTISDGPARDALLRVLLAQPTLRTHLQGQPEPALVVAFDPTGGRLAAGGAGGLGENSCCGGLRIWDVDRARPLDQQPQLRTLGIGELAWSNNGQLAFLGTFGGPWIWDGSSVTSVGFDAAGFEVATAGLALNPQGTLLAAGVQPLDMSAPPGVGLWDVERGQPVGALLSVPFATQHLAFSADGLTLVAAGVVSSVDPVTGEPTATERLRAWATNEITAGSTTPKFDLEGGHGKEGVEVLDLVVRGTELWSLTSGTSDGWIAGWDLGTGQRVAGPQGPSDVPECLHPEFGATSEGCFMALSPDHQVVAQAGPGRETIVLRDGLTGEQLGEPLQAPDPQGAWSGTFQHFAFSPDGRTLAAGGEAGSVVLWDWAEHAVKDRPLRSGAPLDVPDGAAVVVSPAGTIALGVRSGEVRLFDERGNVRPRQPAAQLAAGINNLPLAFSPDGTLLASLERDSTVRVWDVETGALRHELRGIAGGCELGILTFGPAGPQGGAGTVAVGCLSTPTLVWRLTSPEVLPTVRIGTGYSAPVAFAPDGRRFLFAGVGAGLQILDVDSGRPSGPQPPGNADARDAAFDDIGNTLALADSSGGISLFDLRSGQYRRTPNAHAGDISLAFGPFGQTLYSVSSDGTARAWDTRTLQAVGPQLTAPGPLLGQVVGTRAPDLAVVIGGETLIAAGGDGIARWDIGIGSLVSRACAIANRNLTVDEWNQFIGESEAYRKTCPELPLP